MNSIRKKKKHHLKGKTSSPRCVRSTSSKTTTIEKTPPLQTKSRKANGRLVSQLGKTCERSDARASCMPTSKGRCLNSNNSDKNEIKAGQVRMAFSHIEGISCSHFLYSVDMSERLPPGHIMSKVCLEVATAIAVCTIFSTFCRLLCQVSVFLLLLIFLFLSFVFFHFYWFYVVILPFCSCSFGSFSYLYIYLCWDGNHMLS